ncbi:LOW QUALITY PROTEIN: hypothetical protein ACHAW6_005672, partial [Cyclotella cf. meneghiniana]
MYMARSFIIHVSPYWGKDKLGDMSLWPFVDDHAALLSNCIPQWKSGIMPLESAMRTKPDHSDLQLTHVWGCPCNVFEAKLQLQAPQMESISSYMVAPVQNLHMGYISLQYHVVFNNKFQTVFQD